MNVKTFLDHLAHAVSVVSECDPASLLPYGECTLCILADRDAIEIRNIGTGHCRTIYGIKTITNGRPWGKPYGPTKPDAGPSPSDFTPIKPSEESIRKDERKKMSEDLHAFFGAAAFSDDAKSIQAFLKGYQFRKRLENIEDEQNT